MKEFSRRILAWYAANKRDLPWRTTNDPYRILVSEIMLQQTQVDRVIPKYAAWLARFPDFNALAAAPRSDVLKYWSGLGYNNRAVRLHALAKLLVDQHDGKLPATEEELVKLPGIGPYTAGAIMVFAHNQPGRCIDVNIERIMRRVTFSKTTRTVSTKSQTEKLFIDSFPPKHATDYGNALMDFGSLVCTATKPRCDGCPVYALCTSKGERSDEKKTRAKKRAPTFLHSNRWWRGQILKAVNVNGSVTEKELLELVKQKNTPEERTAFKQALRQLREEGLLSSGKKVRIAD